MAWNHKSRIVAMSVAIQAGQGQFSQPNRTTDLIAVSAPTNTHESISADDPTASGTTWESNRILLGQSATLGATIPLRGPGDVAPPALNAWPVGRVLQSAGFAEIRKAVASNGVVQGNVNAFSFNIQAETAIRNFLIGAPIQHDFFGAGFKRTSIIVLNDPTSNNMISCGEQCGNTAAGNYTIPAYLSYQLGTLTGAPVYLSVSIWRDKKRYDYIDFQPTSVGINLPVANEANNNFPDITFQGKALIQAVADDTSPALPSTVLGVQPAPVRNGKFFLDRTRLGHQQLGFTATLTVAGASNQNAAAGQDGYDIISGQRQVSLDLNQMAVADYNIETAVANQSKLPVMATWGTGSGNNFGFVLPSIFLDPFSPGDRNGYVSLTGNAYASEVDKSAALTIWW